MLFFARPLWKTAKYILIYEHYTVKTSCLSTFLFCTAKYSTPCGNKCGKLSTPCGKHVENAKGHFAVCMSLRFTDDKRRLAYLRRQRHWVPVNTGRCAHMSVLRVWKTFLHFDRRHIKKETDVWKYSFNGASHRVLSTKSPQIFWFFPTVSVCSLLFQPYVNAFACWKGEHQQRSRKTGNRSDAR